MTWLVKDGRGLYRALRAGELTWGSRAEAVHYERREDAEIVVAYLVHLVPGVHVTEHEGGAA